jgi:hypothetical protein
MNFNDIIIKALRDKISKSIIFDGDIFELLSSSFENPDNFIDLYKKGNIKNEHSTCIFNLKGRKGNNNIEYQAIINHNLKDISKKFISGSVSAYMVSFIPVILAEMIIKKNILEKGVIAPAGLKNSSDILEESKKLGLNIEESYEWF